MRKLIWALLAVLLLSVYPTTSAQAVHGGESALGDPKVVAIIGWYETNQAGCTGALIAPRVVMTSGHCLSRNPTDGKYPSYNTEDPKTKILTEKDAPIWVAAPGIIVPRGGAAIKAKVIAQFASSRFKGSLLDCQNGGKGDCHGPLFDFGIMILDRPLSNQTFKVATLEEIRDLVATQKQVLEIGYGMSTYEQTIGAAFRDGIPRKIVTTVRTDIIQDNRKFYTYYPELMIVQTRYRAGEYTCGADSGIPAWFEKNGEWIYLGAAGVGMGPECGTPLDDPIWKDPYWMNNSGDQFDTAQAYPEVIEAANKFLAEQIMLEEKAATELKIKQEAEVKAAAELKAKQDAEAKMALEIKAKEEADAKAVADKLAAEKLASTNAASIKKTTITCVKGKLTKKVSAIKPICPKGYKKK
jgi:hypothetical protein